MGVPAQGGGAADGPAGRPYAAAMTSDAAPVPDDPAAWTGERVANWLRLSAGLERQLAPVSDVLFAAAALAPGERVLDVGCGTGPTTREAAGAVGPDGSVTGLDVSAGMLEAAASVPVPDGAAPITWTPGDAVTWDAPAAAFDAVISRFGVMFFSDPAAAFATLAGATAPGGRLAVAVWARRDESPLFEVPLAAALEVTRAHGVADPEGLEPDGGPFSLGDPAAVTALLERAGWSDVAVTPHRLALPFGGGLTPADAAATAAGFGPNRILFADLDDDVRAEAVARVAEVLGHHVDGDGHVVLDGRIFTITARRG